MCTSRVSALLWPHLSAGGTEAILICADAVPAEAADLVAAGAREKVDVIDLQGLHAQWALHWVLLDIWAARHPTEQWSLVALCGLMGKRGD